MANRSQIEKARDDLIGKAQAIRDTKNKEAEIKYKEILAKAQAIYDKQMNSAQEKYEAFVAKVEEDTGKRLNIVHKVIDAESEERRFKEEQERRQKEAEISAAAEQKMADEAEALRKAEEDKKARIAAKKKAKAKKKELALRARVPIPPGFVPMANSKKLYGKLKKLSSAGRYAMCCFYQKKDKKFKAYVEELSGEYNTNVAWFDCAIKDDNFTEAMLLYEFNGTPCVVVCYEGKPSNLHRYVIGMSDDTRATLKRYAEKADAE